MNPLAITGALAIGLSLGLTGAGGSILTLPVLVYLAGVPPQEAVGASLFIVGVAALVGALQRIRSGDFHARAALTFGLAGMMAAVVGARFTALVSAPVLMGTFSILMILVSVRMLSGGEDEAEPEPECRPLRCVAAGTGTGLLTGFIGVGGGFLLIPSLMKFARLPIRVATGTSLAVIAANSAVGWLAHLPTSAKRWDVMGTYGLIAIGGILLGKPLASRLPAKRLRQGFAGMVLLTGAFVLTKAITGH